MLDCGVCGEDVTPEKGGVALRVVDVHFYEVLVEGIRSACPAASGIEEETCFGVDVCADEAWEGFGSVGLGGEEVGFGARDEGGVCAVACEVGETRPFENEGANCGEAVWLFSGAAVCEV